MLNFISKITTMNTAQDIKAFFSYPRQDVVAGIVVFLVAIPLCLGIAIASGVSPISGLVAGIVGGIIVPLVSRSPLSVSVQLRDSFQSSSWKLIVLGQLNAS